MQLLVAFIISLLVSACGPVVPQRIDVVVSGGIEVRPSLDELEQFFTRQCRRTLPSDATEQQVGDCVQTQIDALLQFLRSINK